MKTLHHLIALTSASVLALGSPGDVFRPGRPASAQRLPNVIIVYADDLGYADIGPFRANQRAAAPRTPNLDRMAAEGIRLTNFYVAQAVCSASRAALLTGAIRTASASTARWTTRARTASTRAR